MESILAMLLATLLIGGSAVRAMAPPVAFFDVIQEPEEVITEEENMERTDLIQEICDFLQCSERTAQSLFERLEGIVPGEIAEIGEVSDEYYKILKVTDDSGKEFYAMIGRGYFLAKVYADSVDGEIIYRAMR